MWVDKYRPKKTEDVLGNPKAAADLKGYDWAKPAILYGPTGVGKSALARALADELGFEVIEISDENIASGRSISQTRSLFSGRKLMVFDNVDQIDDIKEVSEILKVTKTPTLLITSDFDSKRLATVKKSAEKFQMKKPAPVSITKLLEKICCAEGIEADKEALKRIAENSEGDFRAAVNDLETVASGRKKICMADLAILESRDRVGDIYRALGTILYKRDLGESIRSTWDLDEQPQNVLLWIDENLPGVVKGPREISRSYDYLSRADVFFGRITNRQYWGFLRYATSLMTGGVTVSKGEKINFARYQFPYYIIRMGQTKKERNLKKSIGLKLSPELHCSSKVAAREYIPLYRRMMEKKIIDSKEFSCRYKLEDEELAYLAGE